MEGATLVTFRMDDVIARIFDNPCARSTFTFDVSFNNSWLSARSWPGGCGARWNVASERVQIQMAHEPSNQAMQRTASKAAIDVLRLCHPRVGCVPGFTGLAVADLVSR